MYNTQIDDEDENTTIKINDILAQTWTSIPCIVQSFNPVEQTITCQPAIQAIKYGADGKGVDVNLPLLVDVPVQYPRGGGVVITFPIKKGDECIVVFAARCIDSWWAYGKVQPQFTQRMQDLSDGMAIVGISSIPNVVGNISLNSVQIRTLAGTSFIELTEAGAVNITCSKLTVTGNIEATGTIKSNGKVIDNSHTHTGVQTGTGTSGVVS